MRILKNELEKGLSEARAQAEEKETIKTSPRPKETLSQREWQQIMGCNQDTYKRHRGSIRRR